MEDKGFSLIEVLVAVVILSIGLLGLGALQATGINNTNNAYFRSQATVLANSLIERMRANPQGFEDGAYAGIDSDTIDCSTPPNPYCAAQEGGAAAECSPGQLAVFDIHVAVCGMSGQGTKRNGGVKDLLPGARLRVTCPAPCAGGSAHTLTLEWNENRKSDELKRSITLVFQR